MVILRTQNKITDFLMMLAWLSRFKHYDIGQSGVIYKIGWWVTI